MVFLSIIGCVVVVLSIGGSLISGWEDAPGGGADKIAGILLVSALLLALPLATAIGLHGRSEWGRIVGMIQSILLLFAFPIGTVIGIIFIAALGERTLVGKSRITHPDLVEAMKYQENRKQT